MKDDLKKEAYYYHLPEKNIAQHPADKRDQSRLLLLNTNKGTVAHQRFSDIAGYFQPGDMLIVNNTKVFPARLTGNKDSGGKIEVFLLELPQTIRPGLSRSIALLKSSRRPQVKSKIIINDSLSCLVTELLDGGKAKLELLYDTTADLHEILSTSGEIPLPPYIRRAQGTTEHDQERYQTVYANIPGAVAAPTAGLHFTKELLEVLRNKGITFGDVTLHVGYGTFAPVRADNITEHQIHEEFVTVSDETVQKIRTTKKNNGRIWAVGTTTVRALEFAAKMPGGEISATEGWCDLYIYPGFTFKVIDNLITNFHLPDSSLMFLVAALCGRETLLDCYKTAIENDYRFFSYGDAMTVITKE